MTKKELQNRRSEIVRSLNNYCDTIAQEKRNFTDEEKQTVRELENEKDSIEIALRNFDNRREYVIADAISEACSAIRSLAKREMSEAEFDFRAVTNATTTTSVLGVATESTVGVIDPLEKGLVLDSIGAQIRTDIARGGKWAVVAPVEAQFEGEAVESTAKKIDVTKKATNPHRITIPVFVSNQALAMGDVDLMNRVIIPNMNRGIRRVLNPWMLQTTAYNSTHGAEGVFVKAATKVTFAGAVPTYAELLALRGKVRAKGIEVDGSERYVMSSLMASTLAATPISAGNPRMIIEDGKIAGIPVVESEYIENGNSALETKGPKYVGFGRFSDLVVAQFGPARLTIDSTSHAAGSADGVYIDINVDYDLVSLYNEAFGLGTATIS